MTKIFKTTTLGAALALIAMPALAQVTPEQVTESLAGQGYTDIQVAPEADGRITSTATNAEGVAVVIIHDSATGQVVSAAAEGQPAPAEAPAAEMSAPDLAADPVQPESERGRFGVPLAVWRAGGVNFRHCRNVKKFCRSGGGGIIS